MSDSPAHPKSCPKCGADLPSEATEGLCPRCILSQAMQGTGPKTPAGRWEPPTAEELQKLLPQYEITALLGRGGMGAVYKGTQKSLDRPVAIKILSNQLEEADASFAERFKNEARSMAKLSHPGIVAVHDFGETPDHLLYIVMEFIEGTDVSRMIAKQKRLHTEHAMAITAHVCDALAYAHERGIIHRDIKPANIMVGYDGVVKVADFGLAKMNSKAGESVGLTQSGMAMGTLHYMAPEALMLGTAVDHRADIYAVGVMLYQMLTGKVPHGMFELPSLQVPGLDPRYDGIIAKAMREDRDIRYQSATEMRYDLDHILTQPVVKVEPEATQAPAALPTEARPQRTAAQPYRPPQVYVPPPKPKSAMGGTLAWLTLIAVLMGGGYYWMKSQQPKSAGTDQQQSEKTAAVQTAPEPEPATGTQPTQTTATTTKAVVTDQDGWRSLFDGKTLTGWKDSVGKWRAKDGLLVCDGTSYLQTLESFGDFELEFDWRVGANADSGVKYRIDAAGGRNVLEFQITSPPRAGSGSLQDLYPESRDSSNPVGQWNTGRILAVGTRCEHWVNGEKVGSYDLAGDDFRDKLSRLGFGADHAFYGLARPGPILLQGLKGQVAFRNLRLRVPSSATPASITKTTAPTPPPAPLTGLDLQLAQLDQSFQAAVERDAGSAFKAAVAKLNAGYNRALDAAIATATKSALLDDVVQLKEEQAAMTKLPASALPPPDEAKTPASLKTLRMTYRNAIAQYTTDYAKALVPLYEKYDQTLTALQAEQTRASKIPEALRIKTQVEIMRQWRGSVLARAVAETGSVSQQLLAHGPANTITPGKSFTNTLGMTFVSVPGTKIHMCIHETRKQDYAAYAAMSAGVDETWKNVIADGKPASTADDHPVAAVSWEDATAFCQWLSKKEGHTYRLPTEFEWNLAMVRYLNDRTSITADALYRMLKDQPPWVGSSSTPPEDGGKFRDTAKHFPTTAPVMSFKPNDHGIYDLGGNVWEWCQDWFDAEQKLRVYRGLSFNNFGPPLKAGARDSALPTAHDVRHNGWLHLVGFRCVVEDEGAASAITATATTILPPSTPSAGPQPASSTGLVIHAPMLGGPEPLIGEMISGAYESLVEDHRDTPKGAVRADGSNRCKLVYKLPTTPVKNLTAAVWVKFSKAETNTLGQIFSCWAVRDDDALRVTVRNSSLAASVESGPPSKTASKVVESGRWYHIAAARTPELVTLYVDGKEISRTTFIEQFQSKATQIGLGLNPALVVHGTPGFEFLAADFADFRVYERVLSESEIVALAKLDKTTVQVPASVPKPTLQTVPATQSGKTVLFDGKTLNGWRVIGDASAFSVENGAIKTSPKQATLLYTGTGSSPAEWSDFEFSAMIKTGDGANSGVWFHTPPDGSGLNEKQTRGFEVQVTRPNGDGQMTGTLYFVTKGTPVSHQGEWFKLRFTVKGRKFTCYINGRRVNEWTQPDDWTPPGNAPEARLGKGTFAIPSWKGEVWFKDIEIRSL